MSRSNKQTLLSDIPEADRHYIGRDKAQVQITTGKPLHWYEAYLMGYRATKWEGGDADRDDIRFDMKETE